MNAQNGSNLLRLPPVMDKVGLAKSSIYARVAAKTFPAPVALGPRVVAWVSAEVDNWIAEQIKAGRPTAQGGQS